MWFCSSQEPVSEEKKEDNEAMGRVDEGVEEFFTKKIIPDYALWVDDITVEHTQIFPMIRFKQQYNTKEILQP